MSNDEVHRPAGGKFVVMTGIEGLKQIIDSKSNIVFFGGAGVSTESGIPDFRGAEGIYSSGYKRGLIPPEEILHADFFYSNTREFYQFYFAHMVHINAKPNAAHMALARLESMGKLKAVITQNIDGLHQMAGSKKVIELHGSIHRNFCMGCKKPYDLDYMLTFAEDARIPTCDICGGVIKPDVVLYGETLKESDISAAVDSIKAAEVLIVGGTSLVVYPAAGLVNHFNGDALVLINKTKTAYDNRADLVINQNIGQVLEAAVLPAGGSTT